MKNNKYVPCRYCRGAGIVDGVKAYICANPNLECEHDGQYKCYQVPVKPRLAPLAAQIRPISKENRK